MLRYIPEDVRLYGTRVFIRKVFRLYLSPQEIVEDIWRRLSYRKIVYWSEVSDDDLHVLQTIRKKVIKVYGLDDDRNRFTVKPFPDLVNNPYAPEALSLWIIKTIRDRAKEYSDAS